jgi:hypothetical protein
LAFVAAVGVSSGAVADERQLPEWEIGAMVGIGILPTYPAADQTRFEVLPLPYLAYRGEILRSDEKGLLRGRLLKSDRVELSDVSAFGTNWR